MASTMMNTSPQLQELLRLPAQERLRLARWLIDSMLEDAPQPAAVSTGLLALAGRYEGGAGDSAERHEEILAAEVDSTTGLSKRS